MPQKVIVQVKINKKPSYITAKSILGCNYGENKTRDKIRKSLVGQSEKLVMMPLVSASRKEIRNVVH